MDQLLARSNVILDSLGDGVYVCDQSRRIVYWSKSAERITGWTSEEVVGRRCLENLLCHIDKDGHRLCGEEFCPLHRSMATGASNDVPIIVFAKAKDGRRVPCQVSVSPIRDAQGDVIGGVETFRDVSAVLTDLERAKRIQTLALANDLPEDARIRVSTFYTPHDYVGGDYYLVRPLDADRYGFLLADVMGHGVSAALHTMHLSSLCDRFHGLLTNPAEFAATLNNELARVVKGESFATAACGVIDAQQRTLRFVGAGSPPAMAFRGNGAVEPIEASGLPFGVLDDAEYDEIEASFAPGDALLLFSDGAFEIHNAQDEMLGVDGLIRTMSELGYPQKAIRMTAVEERLLKFSNTIRLNDDVTFIDVRFL